MFIKFSKNLKIQSIYAQGPELVQVMGDKKRKILPSLDKKRFVSLIKNPVLVTDLPAMVKQIKSSTQRDSVFALYQSYPRIIEYNDVSVWWNPARHKNVWCPSIDTLLFARALNKVFKSHKKIKSALEIGCGSGFLGKYIAQKNKNLSQITFVDINPYAILCAKDNTKEVRAKKKFFTKYWQDLNPDKYDLIVCNPPYVPRPQSIDNNPFEGISLMRDIILNSHKFLNSGGVLVINYSSLCEKEAKRFVAESGMRFKILDKMKVPLKVLPVLNNKDWMGYLQKRQKIVKSVNQDYAYWHTINIIELTNNEK